MALVHVAVGVILRDDAVYITQRPQDKHQGGKWEFPGGKVEATETVPEALTRELQEECGITVSKCFPLIVIDHDYGDKQVKLDVYAVTEFDGEPFGREGQQGKWCQAKALIELNFPEANAPIITAICERIA